MRRMVHYFQGRSVSFKRPGVRAAGVCDVADDAGGTAEELRGAGRGDAPLVAALGAGRGDAARVAGVRGAGRGDALLAGVAELTALPETAAALAVLTAALTECPLP